MGRFLTIDIGAGTMDVLYFNDENEDFFKAVVKSPVRTLAAKAAGMTGNLLATGGEMGGGPVSSALIARARKADVFMTAASAATIHHNPDIVRSFGIRIVPEQDVAAVREEMQCSLLMLGDLEIARLKSLVRCFGVPFRFDCVGICAQDHGVPPEGQSHLDYRHRLFKSVLDRTPDPHALLYTSDQIPPTLNRLRTIGENAANLPADEIYLMDSGMAAIAGSLKDPRIANRKNSMVLDIATSHTLGAMLTGGEIAGFFEYHTRDIDLDRIESLLPDLANGNLDHERILKEGGHGAYMRKAVGFNNVDIIMATGPKRKLLKGSKLPIVFGAPLGDNMMTGTAGLLEAIRKRKGLGSMSDL